MLFKINHSLVHLAIITLVVLMMHCFVWGQTLQQGAPQISVFPPEVHQQIAPEGYLSRNLLVFNQGDEPLEFDCYFSPWQGEGDTTVSWVTASPLSGTIMPGDTTIITLDFNSIGLEIMNYLVDLVINSNDPDNSELRVLAMLHVMPLEIYFLPESDSLSPGDSTQILIYVFGGSEIYTYTWTSNPSGFHSTIAEPVVSPLVDTHYILEVTDGGYSQKDSVLIKVGSTAGLAGTNPVLAQLSLHPNPSTDYVVLHIEAATAIQVEIDFLAQNGQVLKTLELTLQKGMNEQYLPISLLPAGMYLLRIHALHAGQLMGGRTIKLIKK